MGVLTSLFFLKKSRREVEKTLAAIQAARTQPDEVAEEAFRKDCF